MRVANFNVLIHGGRERDSGHVQVSHGQTYKIKLCNHDHTRRCDALVKVDGKEIGLFRVNACDSIVLETPPNAPGRFTFYRAKSAEASRAELDGIAPSDLGLIEVLFRPERYVPPPVPTTPIEPMLMSCFPPAGAIPRGIEEPTSGILRSSGIRPRGMMHMQPDAGFAPGGTGLSGSYQQSFQQVANLNYAIGEEVTISIRLICQADLQNGPRPLQAVRQSNPVPAPVE